MSSYLIPKFIKRRKLKHAIINSTYFILSIGQNGVHIDKLVP